MRHLLVTNDFPPKVGGIQSYLWELWRRLPPDEVSVLTAAYAGAQAFDLTQPFPIVRSREPVLLPSPVVIRRIRRVAAQSLAGAVVLDPALPLGLVGPNLGLPYAVILHGAEVTVPGRLPATRQLLARTISGARLLIAAGGYPEAEARRAVGERRPFPEVVQVPPGVDTQRFRPLASIDRAAARGRLGLPGLGQLVLSVSRLVPRKGMDTLIRAAALLAPDHPDLTVAIAGGGRERSSLERLIRRSGAPVRLLGRVSDADLPLLYGCADLFAMCCRSRWRGLEQEGFGIVFLEAAACGVPSVAGASGGAAEAVTDGTTGLVVDQPDDPAAIAAAIGRLLDDPALASRHGPGGPDPGRGAFLVRPARANVARRPGRRAGGAMSRPPRRRPARPPARPSGAVPPGPADDQGGPAPGDGTAIIRSLWIGTAVYLLAVVVGVLVPDARLAVVFVDLGLFFAGCAVFMWALVVAAGRSRQREIGLWNLFLLEGIAPARVRRIVLGALAVEIVVALGTAWITAAMAFGCLVPMWGLGHCGLWGARYGTFGPRQPTPGRRQQARRA